MRSELGILALKERVRKAGKTKQRIEIREEEAEHKVCT